MAGVIQTYMVTVSIPISVAFDGKPYKGKKLKEALAENFLDHPAVGDPDCAEELIHYIDKTELIDEEEA